MPSAHSQECRQPGEPAVVTRDELKADERRLASIAVEYRHHVPHDELPVPWRTYGSDEFAEGAGSLIQRVYRSYQDR